MSTKIGIVSEGISDYQVLKHIIERYLRDEDIYTIPLKPKMTSKRKQEGFGTWQGVLEYISGTDEQKLIIEASKEDCRFIIIQIDTDVCEEYGVKKDTADISLFWDQVKGKLENEVHAEFDTSILLFAICIHELECWLIPFVSTENKKCTKFDGCLNTLNRVILTKGNIDKENKNSDGAKKLYEFILKQKRKPKEIEECAQYNFGFSKLITQLNQVKVVLQQEIPKG